jgi:hypothetical protein
MPDKAAQQIWPVEHELALVHPMGLASPLPLLLAPLLPDDVLVLPDDDPPPSPRPPESGDAAGVDELLQATSARPREAAPSAVAMRIFETCMGNISYSGSDGRRHLPLACPAETIVCSRLSLLPSAV